MRVRPIFVSGLINPNSAWLPYSTLPFPRPFISMFAAAGDSPHSFRATGITNFLENDGTLEAAQRIAGHADETL